MTQEPLSEGERRVEEMLRAEGARLREELGDCDPQEGERFWQALLERAGRRTDRQETLVSALEAILRRSAQLPPAPEDLSLDAAVAWHVRQVVERSDVVLHGVDERFDQFVTDGFSALAAFLDENAGGV